MNKEPKVSVIIPTYNRINFLCEAIESVLNQTYSNIEIIVVDDGSTDNTQEVLKNKYSSQINYIYQENRGLSAARNQGIRVACGEYIQFLDDDDIIYPEKIEKQLLLFEKERDIAMVLSNGYLFFQKTHKRHKWIMPDIKGQISADCFIELIGPPICAFLIKSICFKEVGMFDENLHYFEDTDMWFRFVKKKYKVGHINGFFWDYRIHNKDVRSTLYKIKQSFLYLSNKYESYFKQNYTEKMEFLASDYFILCYFFYHSQNIESAKIFLLQGFIECPKSAKFLNKEGLVLIKNELNFLKIIKERLNNTDSYNTLIINLLDRYYQVKDFTTFRIIFVMNFKSIVFSFSLILIIKLIIKYIFSFFKKSEIIKINGYQEGM